MSIIPDSAKVRVKPTMTSCDTWSAMDIDTARRYRPYHGKLGASRARLEPRTMAGERAGCDPYNHTGGKL
jgi:hypothetical protein